MYLLRLIPLDGSHTGIHMTVLTKLLRRGKRDAVKAVMAHRSALSHRVTGNFLQNGSPRPATFAGGTCGT
jgi:hypothetical protein